MIGPTTLWQEDLETRVPPGFQRRTPQVETGSGAERLREVPVASPRRVAVWRLRARLRSLRPRRPLLIRFYSEEGFVFAENETLAITGTGTTFDEAMADFSSHVSHFYDYYKRMPKSKLVGDALRLKDAFLGLFIEE